MLESKPYIDQVIADVISKKSNEHIINAHNAKMTISQIQGFTKKSKAEIIGILKDAGLMSIY
ncbi:hypothetical protein COB57_00115 [Candidatus Peregrinibacteria bacterium]|nr:MAG: hypothetical protein COB57_00115 [Candidatus Peregrinibacteria bacterium]